MSAALVIVYACLAAVEVAVVVAWVVGDAQAPLARQRRGPRRTRSLGRRPAVQTGVGVPELPKLAVSALRRIISLPAD